MPVDHKVNKEKFFQAKRQKWIWDNCVPALVQSILTRETIQFTDDQAFELFLSADPSPNKSATQWLIECYIRGGFLIEDLAGGNNSKVCETLLLFSRYKNQLSLKERNLYEYKSLGDVYKAIDNFSKSENLNMQGQALKKANKSAAIKESYVLLDDQDLKIVIPRTMFAARWWGQGTRWCTSAENYNMFKTYNQQAPLIIFIFTEKLVQNNQIIDGKQRKFQLWTNENNLQFMDEMDNPVDLKFVHDHWVYFEKLINPLLNFNIKLLEYVPEHLRDHKHYQSWIKKDITRILDLPEDMISQDTFDQACANNVQSIRVIPEKFKTEEMCLQAVQTNGSLIKEVPLAIQTQEICLAAIENDPTSICLIDSSKLTQQMIIKSAEKNESVLSRLDSYRFPEKTWLDLIKKNPKVLPWIPKETLTYEMCELAIKNENKKQFSFSLLRVVPDQFKTKKLCMLALENNKRALDYVPVNFYTSDILINCVKEDGGILYMINKEIKDKNLNLEMLKYEQICYEAVNQLGIALELVPEQIRSHQICLAAVKNNGLSLYCVPKHIISFDLCKIAVKDQGEALCYVPEKLKTQEICTIACQQTGKALEYVPELLKTQELCLLACDQTSDALQFLPKNLVTPELCTILVQKNVRLFDKLPTDLITNEIVQAVLNQNPYAFDFIPRNYVKENWKQMYKQVVKQNEHNILETEWDIKTYTSLFDSFGSSNLKTLSQIDNKHIY